MNRVWVLNWGAYVECAFPSAEKAIEYVVSIFNENNRKCRAFTVNQRITFEFLDGGVWLKSDAVVKGIPLYV